MKALVIATLAATTAPKQHVSGEMLMAVSGGAFIGGVIIGSLIAKATGSKNPLKIGVMTGGVFGFVAFWGVIAVIAAHRM